jgi:hypothetical protein
MDEIVIKISTREDRTDLILKVEKAVLATWERRRLAQGYEFQSKKTRQLQAEFLSGMVATMDVILEAEKTRESSITPKMFFSIIRGEYIE